MYKYKKGEFEQAFSHPLCQYSQSYKEKRFKSEKKKDYKNEKKNLEEKEV